MSRSAIIKLLGILFVATGSIHLILNAKGIWWSLFDLFHPGHFMTIQDYFVVAHLSLLLRLVLPVAILISGYGLLEIRRWGWSLAIINCVVTFIRNFLGILYVAVVSFKLRNQPMPTFPEGGHIFVVSMWPNYIYILASALLMFLLTRKSLRDAFNH
jgi:hypothetical protein